jgi:hypothetical protein
MIIDATSRRRRNRREFDPKPMFGERVRLSAKQAPAHFKAQYRERSPLMGHLQRLEVAASLRRKMTGVKRRPMRQFCDKNAASGAIDMAQNAVALSPRRRSSLKEIS